MQDDLPFELPSPPATIEPGRFQLVFNFDASTGDPVPVAIQFNWDGGTTAAFQYDAWMGPDQPTFVAEVCGSPVTGWASWVNGEDVLVAFECSLADEEGWARIEDGAPASSEDEPDEVMDQPEVWVEFAKKILAVGADHPLEGMTRQTY